MRQEYKMKWTRRESARFIIRLVHITAAGTGLDDVDLRSLVRNYNRELIGERHVQGDS